MKPTCNVLGNGEIALGVCYNAWKGRPWKGKIGVFESCKKKYDDSWSKIGEYCYQTCSEWSSTYIHTRDKWCYRKDGCGDSFRMSVDKKKCIKIPRPQKRHDASCAAHASSDGKVKLWETGGCFRECADGDTSIAGTCWNTDVTLELSIRDIVDEINEFMEDLKNLPVSKSKMGADFSAHWSLGPF